MIEEVVGESHVYYIREPDGSLIARVGGGSTQYYHFDALGSTKLLTDATGAVTDTYSYDAWGNATHESGSTEQPYMYVGQLGYYTRYQDANLFDESGWQLLQLGVRFYDPEVGRFTQRDPMEEFGPDYTYADDQPTDGTDPTGLLRWPPGMKGRCPNLRKAIRILIAALRKPACRKFWGNAGCTLRGENDPFLIGQGPRVIIGDPGWAKHPGADWGKPHNGGGYYGECGCNGLPGPRQGDIIINQSLCHGRGNAKALAATLMHESAHWCVCHGGHTPGDPGSWPTNPNDPRHSGEGYGAERACFGEVVW